MRTRALIIALVVITAGCTSSNYQPGASGQLYPPYEGEVRVLSEMPWSGYEQIGTATAGGNFYHGDKAMLDALKKQAREAGSDTIVIVAEPKKNNGSMPVLEPAKTQQAVLLRRR